MKDLKKFDEFLNVGETSNVLDESKMSNIMSKMDLSACSAHVAKVAANMIKTELVKNDAFNENISEMIYKAITKVGMDMDEDEVEECISPIFNKILNAMVTHCKQFKMTK
jgi:hypothetical protein